MLLEEATHTEEGSCAAKNPAYLVLSLQNEDNNIGLITYNINVGNYPNEKFREKCFVNINLQQSKT